LAGPSPERSNGVIHESWEVKVAEMEELVCVALSSKQK
jgi:hypothetical protein